VDEVTDEPLYRDRVCGIDIGKAELYATIRVPSDKNPARRAAETRSFATTRRGGWPWPTGCGPGRCPRW
jgi:transposase